MISLETRMRWEEWNTALYIIREGENMGFYRKDSEEEDQIIAEAHSIILDNLSNADSVGQIEIYTGKNLRDQLSVEQAEELYREKELRGYGSRRN